LRRSDSGSLDWRGMGEDDKRVPGACTRGHVFDTALSTRSDHRDSTFDVARATAVRCPGGTLLPPRWVCAFAAVPVASRGGSALPVIALVSVAPRAMARSGAPDSQRQTPIVPCTPVRQPLRTPTHRCADARRARTCRAEPTRLRGRAPAADARGVDGHSHLGTTRIVPPERSQCQDRRCGRARSERATPPCTRTNAPAVLEGPWSLTPGLGKATLTVSYDLRNRRTSRVG